MRKYRRWTWYFLLLSLDFLHRLGHEAAHPLGGILLHLPGDMGVGVQREARTVVAQDAGHCLGIHSLLDCQRGECVAQSLERDVFGDLCLLQQSFVKPSQAVRAIEPADHRRREHHWIAGVFGVFLDQQLYRFFRQVDCPYRVGSLGLGHLYQFRHMFFLLCR